MIPVTSPTKYASKAVNLIGLALALGARQVPDWSRAELDLVADLPQQMPLFLASMEQGIHRGEDPLGDLFCTLFSTDDRRPMGLRIDEADSRGT